MIKSKTLLLTTLVCVVLTSFTIFKFPEIKDYLKTGHEIMFNKDKYVLKWSSHPSENYYKQEYLKSGEELTNYHNMILVEAINDDIKIKDVLKLKVDELELRKKWDYVANYQVLENKDLKTEGVIDFVVSDTMYIYEWNLYRYQVQQIPGKKNVMVLFAYSFRDSLNDDNDLKKFFDDIKANRVGRINQLTSFEVPKVSIPE